MQLILILALGAPGLFTGPLVPKTLPGMEKELCFEPGSFPESECSAISNSWIPGLRFRYSYNPIIL